MTEDISFIWSYPNGGAVPDLSPQLEAADLAELFSNSQPHQDRALSALEAGRDRVLDEARKVAEGLRAKGIHMDVDRMMRGSMLERLQDKWYDLKDWWQDRGEAEDDAVPNDAVFAFDMPLALTHPVSTLSFDYDVIDAEVARVVEGLTRQITVSRGRGPISISLPDDVIDDFAEGDDWSNDENTIAQAGDIVGYWPPLAGASALALSVVQEDGGHVIEVKLLAHGAAAHRRFVKVLADHGGALT